MQLQVQHSTITVILLQPEHFNFIFRIRIGVVTVIDVYDSDESLHALFKLVHDRLWVYTS